MKQCDDLAVFKEALNLVVIEDEMKRHDQVDCPVDHHFAEGLYVRTMFIPAGTLIMGKRHRLETCNFLIKGEISIYNGPDSPPTLFIAPCVFNSVPGTKKLGFTHSDVIFTNIHPTDKTDLDQIENDFIIDETEYLEQIGGQQQ